MKFAINTPNFGDYSSPDVLIELAKETEEAGWDGYFLWDHLIMQKDWHIPFIDPCVALAAMAVATNRIRIGSMITPVARRRPWKLARETVSIDHLSNGRLILGVGLGAPLDDFKTFGEVTDNKIRAEMLDEGLDVLLGLWKGESFSYSGKHYEVEEVSFLPKPVQTPRIPIWVAGMWPIKKPFHRAARWDGAVPMSVDVFKQISPVEAKDLINYISKYRKKPEKEKYDIIIAGETPNDPEQAAAIISEYAEAGVTWWSENLNGMRGSLEEMKERICAGPPEL